MGETFSYPIGQFQPKPFSEDLKEEWLADIKFLPAAVENAILNLDEAQLETPYREGGWTVQQVVHHLADSHMNAYCRFKLGFTENNPTIKPYDQDAWGKTSDVDSVPVNVSTTLLHALHHRMHVLIQSFTIHDFEKTVFHPEHQTQISLWDLLGTYAWHGKHHVAHITRLRERKEW